MSFFLEFLKSLNLTKYFKTAKVVHSYNGAYITSCLWQFCFSPRPETDLNVIHHTSNEISIQRRDTNFVIYLQLLLYIQANFSWKVPSRLSLTILQMLLNSLERSDKINFCQTFKLVYYMYHRQFSWWLIHYWL